MHNWYQLPILIGIAVTVLILGLAFTVLWKILTDRIDLSELISEDGKASLSRFQLLVFTFVIAGVYLLLCIESGTFVDIPESVLGLLGISSASYVLAKGISHRSTPGPESPSAPQPIPTEPRQPGDARTGPTRTSTRGAAAPRRGSEL